MKNRVSTLLLGAGFVTWLLATLTYPMVPTLSFVLTGCAIGLFLASAVVGLLHRPITPGNGDIRG